MCSNALSLDVVGNEKHRVGLFADQEVHCDRGQRALGVHRVDLGHFGAAFVSAGIEQGLKEHAVDNEVGDNILAKFILVCFDQMLIAFGGKNEDFFVALLRSVGRNDKRSCRHEHNLGVDALPHNLAAAILGESLISDIGWRKSLNSIEVSLSPLLVLCGGQPFALESADEARATIVPGKRDTARQFFRLNVDRVIFGLLDSLSGEGDELLHELLALGIHLLN